jgi:hypothetical protein
MGRADADTPSVPHQATAVDLQRSGVRNAWQCAILRGGHVLARMIYRMLKFGHDYVDRGIESYEARYQQQQLQRIRKQAATLDMQLVPLTRVVG